MSAARQWALIGLLATLVGLLNFSIVVTSWLAEDVGTSPKYPFLWEMTGAYTFVLLLPPVLALMRRFPMERRRVWRWLPLHLLAMTLFGVTHTLLMYGTRTLIYRMLGWGTYEYGDLRFRFLMEGQKQALGYWLTFAVLTLLAYARRNRERELATARLQQQLDAARLSVLKTQLNPHFLFNTLNMISSHLYDEPATADAMIGHLSEFLRLTLRHSDAQQVPLEQELDFLRAYLAIMNARFGDRLAVEVQVGPESGSALVPHLLLQPLVENAITHCMDGSGSCHVRVSARSGEGRLRLAVEDDGPGFPGPIEAALGRGVGLSNTAERLRHLYGPDHRLSMANRPGGGLRLELDLPLRRAS